MPKGRNTRGNRRSVERESLLPDDTAMLDEEPAPHTSAGGTSTSSAYSRTKAGNKNSGKSQGTKLKGVGKAVEWDPSSSDETSSSEAEEEDSEVYASDGETVIMTRRKVDLVQQDKITNVQELIIRAHILEQREKQQDNNKQQQKAKAKGQDKGLENDGTASSVLARDSHGQEETGANDSKEEQEIPDDYNDLEDQDWHPVFKWGFTLAFWALFVYLFMVDKRSEQERLEQLQRVYLWFYKYASTAGGLAIAGFGIYEMFKYMMCSKSESSKSKGKVQDAVKPGKRSVKDTRSKASGPADDEEEEEE